MNRAWPTPLLLALAACEGSAGLAGPLQGVLALDGGEPVGLEEETGTLVLVFEHRFGSEPLALQTTYSTRYGQDVSFDQLRYWVSNVAVAHGDEPTYEVPASYYLVEQTAEHERLEVEVSGVPAGQYDQLTFHLGVDPDRNAMREGGYTFFQAEGEFSERGTRGHFVMQTGTDALYKRLTADLSVPLFITGGVRTGITVQADLNGLFAALELGETSDIRGGALDSLAGKVAGNYARMFSLETPWERVPLLASSPAAGTGETRADATPPSLTQAIVDLGAGLFCDEVEARPSSQARACFSPFVLEGSDDYRDAGFFSLVTRNDQPVFAASSGMVAEVRSLGHSLLTHSELFMVAIRAAHDSAFAVEYRNLKNLAVEEGEEVRSGQLLGGAGDYFDPGIGVVSLGVTRRQELVQRVCPTRYMSPELASEYEAALARSNAAWPALAHDDLCQTASLVCKGAGGCAEPADFEAAAGDVDEGRRIYASSCASCHGPSGGGSIGPRLCTGPGCPCIDCVNHARLSSRTEQDMPPEGHCNARCAADVAAFILHEFR